ncbi:MAG: formylglycine-generating enzyme family protein [Phycisphaeraceae bacterium]
MVLLHAALLQLACSEEPKDRVEEQPVTQHCDEQDLRSVPLKNAKEPQASPLSRVQESRELLTHQDLRCFTDRLVFPAFTESDDASTRLRAEQDFEMILVPGDLEKGISPFYLSKTEVRGAMFWPWAFGHGMGWNTGDVARKLGFYPSEIPVMDWSGMQIIADTEQQPAIAMSRKVAEQYCKTLSELTGRSYRLPTLEEWEHALALGGGVPSDQKALTQIAHLNVPENILNEPPFMTRPAAVGSKTANRLGLYDLLGNAAEWVTGTGERRVVKGGHFQLEPEQLTDGWEATEDLEVWNETYPQRPPNRSWYRDFYFTGIRLACDVDQAPIPASDAVDAPETHAP